MFVERNIFLNKIINYCIRCLENWKINWICIFVYICKFIFLFVLGMVEFLNCEKKEIIVIFV